MSPKLHLLLLLLRWNLSNPNTGETCLTQTLNKPESYINQTFNQILMSEIFINSTCINWTPVYLEYISWMFSLDRIHCIYFMLSSWDCFHLNFFNLNYIKKMSAILLVYIGLKSRKYSIIKFVCKNGPLSKCFGYKWKKKPFKNKYKWLHLRNIHMNWTSFKRSPISEGHIFFVPNVNLLIQAWL